MLDECNECPDSGGGGGGRRRRTVAMTLAVVPLDLARLHRLPPPCTTATEDDVDDNNSGGGGGGGIGNRRGDDCDDGAMVAPHSLLPNAILVRFDDGRTRMMPELYRLLVRGGVVADNMRLTRFDMAVHGSANPMMDMYKRVGSGSGPQDWGRGGGNRQYRRGKVVRRLR